MAFIGPVYGFRERELGIIMSVNSIIVVTRSGSRWEFTSRSVFHSADEFLKSLKLRSLVAVRLLEHVLPNFDELKADISLQDDETGFITSECRKISDLPDVIPTLVDKFREFLRRCQREVTYTRCSVHAWIPEYALTIVLHSVEAMALEQRDVEVLAEGVPLTTSEKVETVIRQLIDVVEDDREISKLLPDGSSTVITRIFAGREDATIPNLRLASYHDSDKEILKDVLHNIELSEVVKLKYRRFMIALEQAIIDSLYDYVGEFIRKKRKEYTYLKIEFIRRKTRGKEEEKDPILIVAESPEKYARFFQEIAYLVRREVSDKSRDIVRAERGH